MICYNSRAIPPAGMDPIWRASQKTHGATITPMSVPASITLIPMTSARQAHPVTTARLATGRRNNVSLMQPPATHSLSAARCAFTLIELILVMAILTMAVSVTAPVLSNFFRGRSLDSEARRLLALTHAGQSRAVSEGLPMDLWIDATQGTFGLEAEPSYENSDPHAVQFTLDSA